ncbi:hypothetical protein EYB26_008194 [Talaromyces marneffei]|uniref:Purine-cytosine permease fcyB n=1 Tax=Talaromyces marneffei PM1 TaxID=1077442 RepID=A0A093X730_TALMA|nr:uncharacterized protein EYB26_008194 [Talaromyces marneffei]QGA20490.1 hypothetical protein EYB26_008194 [Talaromyces marneffei]
MDTNVSYLGGVQAEKSPCTDTHNSTKERDGSSTQGDIEMQPTYGDYSRYTVWTKVRSWSNKVGAEEFGIERISEEIRTNQHPRDYFTIFFAANCNTATLATGFLGPVTFGLGWWDSFLAIVFFNVLGGLYPAVMATLGPKLGLRTMIIPRYSFGWWPAKILAILNVINQVGWGVVNCISGAAVLSDVGSHGIPMFASIIIVGIIAIVLGLFGYKVLHFYSRYSWMIMLVCFAITAGFGARHFMNVPMGSGSLEASNILSFSTSIIGFQAAWAPIAADYGVYMREDTKATVTFSWAYAGLLSGQILLELLGAAIGTLYMNPNPRFQTAYDEHGLGGLFGSVYEGINPGVRGFGYFIEVLIGLSTAAVITTNIYSLGLSVQMITKKLVIVPRPVWSFVGSIAFLAIALALRDHFEDVLENFLLVCAYWLVPFCMVLILEHFIWRRHYEYDLNAWNDHTRLPYGIAAGVAWVCGTAIAVVSMSQSWWIGPIAAAIPGSSYGTDISWILGAVVSSVLYIPIRIWEKKRWEL